jgi:hypothetical protein
MKANNGSGNIPERDEWQTPNELMNKLDEQYCFGFDCCSKKMFFDLPYSKDFLKEKCLDGYICWMNPPFSKAKDMFNHFFKVVVCGVAIYRCDNFETDIWQNVIFPNATWVFIPDHRVVYEGLNGSGARFPSALIGLNVDTPIGLKGVCLKVKSKGET